LSTYRAVSVSPRLDSQIATPFFMVGHPIARRHLGCQNIEIPHGIGLDTVLFRVKSAKTAAE
jgi:hypothetical protein